MKKICIFMGHHFEKTRGGGAELQAHFLSKELTSYFEVHYVYYSSSNSSFHDQETNVFHHTIRKKISKFNFFDRLNYKEYKKLFTKIKPDIVYQRGFHHYDISVKLKKLIGYKLVTGISMDSQCMKERFNFSLRGLVSSLNSSALKSVLRNSDVIISQTKYQEIQLFNNFNLKSKVIPNFHDSSTNFFPKLPIICWVGSIKKWKRPELFFEFSRLFNKEFKFFLVGPIVDIEYKPKIRSWTEESSNNFFFGRVSYYKVNKLLAYSKFLINTSKPYEGFPNSFIQAWQNGALVLSDNFDPDNIIEEKGYGKVSSDIFELKDYTLENLSFSIKSSESKKFALNTYSSKNIMNKYIDMFNELV